MHEHHQHIHFFRNRELNELYISVAIKSFATSMIIIFLPIYLLKLDYSLAQVFIFYAVLSATHSLFVIPAAKVASKFGFKHAIFFSAPILIIFYLALYTLEQFNWPIYLLAVIYGISNALYFLGYHVDFARFSDHDNRGKEISLAKIFTSIFSIIGPIVGGLILTFIGFEALFAVVSVVLMVSVIPLFYSKDPHKPIHFSAKEIFRKRKFKDTLAFIGHGVESVVSGVIWPIFIYFYILNNFTTLGLVTSLSLLFSLFFIIIIGKFSDVYRRIILKIGSLLTAVINIIRFFVQTTWQVFILDSFYGMSQTLIQIPFNALSYDKANNSHIIRFTIYREIIIQAGRVIFFLIMASITTLTIGFFFGSGASLLLLFF